MAGYAVQTQTGMMHAKGTGDWFTRCHANAVHDWDGVKVLEGDEMKGKVTEDWEQVDCPPCLDKMPKRVKAELEKKK